ncbi:copper resistance CopC/CopD family protein [Amycolatopsis sp. NPDC059657]|uniref:copper resistance CopC/CopD family protein n=1 Tax=Amycolatopsis sp. NPDC059657 TaxID=3346899 RepID=UPI00366C0F29
MHLLGPARARRRLMLARLLGVVGLLFTLAVFGAPPASAHVEIISTIPAEGTRLQAVPPLISLRLTENIGIQQDSLHVVDERGTRVDDGPVFQPGEESEVVGIRLKPGLSSGSYLVTYGFISADSHPVRGSFAFVVGDGPLLTASGSVSASNGTNTTVDVIHTALRWVSFCGLALLGGLLFVLLCRPDGRGDRLVRRVILGGCAATAVASLGVLVLQGPYVAGQDLSAVADLGLLGATLKLSYGKLMLLRVVILAVVGRLAHQLLGPDTPSRPRYENLTMVAGFVLLLTFSATGHAIADPVPFFSLTADMAHLGGIALWIGGLVQIALCLWRPASGEDLALVLSRFSTVAFVSVATIVASGAYLSWRSVASFPALFTTTYGVLLLIKLAGFVLLLAAANASRNAVRRRAVAVDSGGSVATDLGTLRLAVTAEVAIASVVLVLAAILSSTAPAR